MSVQSLVLKELFTQYESIAPTEAEMVDVGPYSKLWLYIRVTALSGGTLTLVAQVGPLARKDTLFEVATITFDAEGAIGVPIEVWDCRFMGLRSEVAAGESAAWEALGVPKFGHYLP